MGGIPATVDMQPLPLLIRLYVYGIQGFADEVVFTSLFDFIAGGNWQLKGHSSLSSFLLFGSCSLFTERLYVFLYYKKGIQWYFRLPLYVLIAYAWELSWGLLLRRFDACPWDYSHYSYNFMGLITLWYAPGWLLLGYLQDVLADFLLRVRVRSNMEETLTCAEAASTPNGYVSDEKKIH